MGIKTIGGYTISILRWDAENIPRECSSCGCHGCRTSISKAEKELVFLCGLCTHRYKLVGECINDLTYFNIEKIRGLKKLNHRTEGIFRWLFLIFDKIFYRGRTGIDR